ncbi:MAG: hypothetical protein A3F18_00610 [Legionellales bacterium RIFCSPHIGHO2_12_FULL_37_14]|nr:MAG: hypothetical protein A3F18_00610 [Legionellales bacterium RIFCSPHIGHO2_12_FULL_37_14]
MSIEFESFIFGFMLALGLILPLGQQNLFVLASAMKEKRFIGTAPIFITSALCDTILIVVSTLGLSVFVLRQPIFITFIRIIGVTFLIYIGINSWRDISLGKSQNGEKHSVKKRVLLTATMSLLNPHAIIDTLAIIGTNYLSIDMSGRRYFVLACVIVSWLWFMALSLLGLFMLRFDRIITYQGKVSAIIMWVCAAYIGIQIYK